MRTYRDTKKLFGALGLAGIAAAALAVFAERPAEAVAIPDLKLTKFGVESGLLTVLFAKELCSCHFVDGLPLDQCLATSNLPSGADKVVGVDIDENAKTVSSHYTVLAHAFSLNTGPSAAAAFDQNHPEFGCVLTAGPGITQ
jgi:hypothetical protein